MTLQCEAPAPATVTPTPTATATPTSAATIPTTPTTTTSPPPLRARLRHASSVVVHHARKHVGTGMICAVAYFDPGNWGVDLQAGSVFGYHLLFVVLLSGLFAVFLQVLATRLGCVTGMDLATHTRLLLLTPSHGRRSHPHLVRWLALYPLYALAEVAVVATDLAELLGSAMALCMLFPRLEVWQGVVITAGDVVLVLGVGLGVGGLVGGSGRGEGKRGRRGFEVLIAGMVIAVLICLVIVIARVHVDWRDAFEGYLPSKFIFKSGGLYTSVGILGATVMPHSLYLGSALATQDRVGFHATQSEPEPEHESGDSYSHPNPHPHPLRTVNTKASDDTLSSSPSDGDRAVKPSTPPGTGIASRLLRSFVRSFARGSKEAALGAFRTPPRDDKDSRENSDRENRNREDGDRENRENNTHAFVQAHLYHGTVDVVGSLLGFAVVINSMILMLAAAVFFYGQGRTTIGEAQGPASLFDAYDVIRDNVGQAAATLFAIALLAAGQSSSLIATVAGQVVCEGFLQWRVSPVMRRVFTRLLAIIPSMAVAIALGRNGIDALLVVSQVVLSIVLPFVMFPLLWCTASSTIMSVRKRKDPAGTAVSGTGAGPSHGGGGADAALVEDGEGGDEVVDYSNNRLTVFVGVAIWLVVVAANLYVIIELALGTSGS